MKTQSEVVIVEINESELDLVQGGIDLNDPFLMQRLQELQEQAMRGPVDPIW